MTRHDAMFLMLIAICVSHTVFLWVIYCKVDQVWQIAKKAEADELVSKEARDLKEWEATQGWKIG